MPRDGCSTGPTSSLDLRMGYTTMLNAENTMKEMLLLLWLHFSRLTLDVIIEPPVCHEYQVERPSFRSILFLS
jgi:hypothetical protein